jgi:hypothetical protein
MPVEFWILAGCIGLLLVIGMLSAARRRRARTIQGKEPTDIGPTRI